MNQVKYNYLRSLGYAGELNDMLAGFYKSMGAVGNELNDLEMSFLTQSGFTSGVLQDRWKAYVVNLGYTGALQDALFSIWREGAFAQAILKSDGPGAWYDPSDLTTLFQDSAGTTPVTAVEQPAGLVLDKSKGLVLGSELVTNGTFDTTTTGWNAGNAAVLSVVSGRLRVTNGAANYGFASQTMTTVVGRTYVATLNCTKGTLSGLAHLRASFTGGGAQELGNAGISASGDVRLVFTAVSATTYLSVLLNNENGAYSEFDNISVRELPGNHLIQPTATSRPTLSSRYNLLTKTEQFDDVWWIKTTGTTVTANAAIAPDGTLTADMVSYDGSGVPGSYRIYSGTTQVGINGAGYTTKVWLRADAPVTIAIGGNVAAGPYTEINVTTQWQQFAISGIGDGVHMIQFLIYSAAGNNAPFQVYAWGSSITNAADASLPYQRVNTAADYDYDFSKFPAYLKFDGIDDSLYSAASIDFTSTDKMTVFAGVHKVSTSSGTLFETSSNSDTNNGSFSYATGPWGDTRDYFSTRGSVLSYPSLTVAPPDTYVITAASDISGDLIVVRKDAGQVVNSSADLGTGNFGNYPLYVGRRNNASLPFNGRLYQLAIKGKALSAVEISTVESFINIKTKVDNYGLSLLMTEAGYDLITESNFYIELE